MKSKYLSLLLVSLLLANSVVAQQVATFDVSAEKLQKTLAKDVPAQFYLYAKGSDKLAERLVKADRLSRIFPDVLSLRLLGVDFNREFRNPALALHNLNQIAYWSFLRDRYQRETQDLHAQKSRHEPNADGPAIRNRA